ncbi:MAG TPA: alpha/beta hydrolase [Myxococcales bacterium]|nr:alpha/beta hydrolase [Myxococcales bacterium]
MKSTVVVRAAASCALAALGARAEKKGYAPVNGLQMYYEVHGKGRPVVLLHGGGSTIETSFGKVLPSLARSRQVIAFEQQGHGHTPDVEGRPFSFEQSADDAAALLRYLGIEKADFWGYSNGGTIALQVALRHPGLVRKLVLVSALFKRDGAPPEFWESMHRAKLEEMPAELQAAYLATAPHPEQLPIFFQKSVQRMLTFKDIRAEDIRSIKAPALVLIGDRDVVRPEHAVETVRLLQHAELAVLPGADHAAVVQRADLLLSIVPDFLDSPMPR